VTDTPSPSPSPVPSAQPAPAPAPAASTPTPASPAGTTTPTPSLPGRPEYIPDSHWDAGAGKVKDDAALSAHFNEIFARDAAEQSRRLSLPQSPDAYKVELPPTFQAPQGVEFKLDANNPLWPQAQAWAHKNGISQDAFAEGLALIAGDRIATEQSVSTARNAEIAKLGTTGPARVDAVTTVFKSLLGEAEGMQLASRMFTAKDVEIAEKLVARITNPGGTNYSARGREAPLPAGRATPEEVAKMSPAQKLDYSRKFNQAEMPAWKDPRAA